MSGVLKLVREKWNSGTRVLVPVNTAPPVSRYIGRPGVHMTRTTNARIAGFTFLFYIVAGIVGMVLFGQATGGGFLKTNGQQTLGALLPWAIRPKEMLLKKGRAANAAHPKSRRWSCGTSTRGILTNSRPVIQVAVNDSFRVAVTNQTTCDSTKSLPIGIQGVPL